MGNHLKGLVFTSLGVLLVVPDSLFVRLIEAEPMVTAFWRGLTAGVFVLLALLSIRGLQDFRAVFRTGWPGLIYTVLIATTAPAFVLAVANTSVANVVFILASMPIFSAIFSRMFLGEPILMRMVLTMAAVILGLAIIVYGSSSTQTASWKGDIWAVYVSVAFAAALTAVRTVKATSMIPAIPFAYIGVAIVVGMFVSPVEAFATQWPLFLGHGAFIGAASCLLTLGPRYISSTEVSLLKPPTIATDSTRRPSGKMAAATSTCEAPWAGHGNLTERPSVILSRRSSRKAASSTGSWRSG